MTENICSKLRACLNQKVEDNCCLIPVQWVKDTIELIEQQQIDIEYFKTTCCEYYNKYDNIDHNYYDPTTGIYHLCYRRD